MGAFRRLRNLFSITSDSHPITLGVRGREFHVRLDPGLPEDAYRQLFLVDLPASASGCATLTWDGNSWNYR